MRAFFSGRAALFLLASYWLCAAQSALAAPAPAEAYAVVEAVQMPAWVERSNSRIPLAPSMELRDGDRLHTGANAKLLVKMREGSSVKLGENGTLLLDRMSEDRNRIFDAVMNVFKGAFRFTTDVLQAQRRRNITITIATVTAGIRGTDLWGKAASDKDIVCLIEGNIEVRHGEEQPFRMDQPLSFYIAPKNAPALPVAPVDPQQFKRWAEETEIAPGSGAARRGGKWKVEAASVETQAEALRFYDALREAGYAAEIRPVMAAGKRIYIVRVAHLATRADAEALAAAIRGRMGVTAPKVGM